VETALVVPVPEAEEAVGHWRRRHASDAADGMWAHVTLLYPFRDSSAVDETACRGIEAALSPFGSFEFELVATAYFRSEPTVLYLVPAPAAPFVAMTRALAAAFPDTPPYGGAYAEVVPHLSVGDEADASLLAEAEADVSRRLPIGARAGEAELVEHAPSGWRRRHVVTLGA
jgi:2'-5' RNA ligase